MGRSTTGQWMTPTAPIRSLPMSWSSLPKPKRPGLRCQPSRTKKHRESEDTGRGHARLLGWCRDRREGDLLVNTEGVVMTNELVNLREQLDRQFPEEWKKSLTGVYLAASAQLLMKQREANEWISHYRLHGESSGNEFSSSLAEDAQYLTIVARHFPAKLHDLPTKEIEQVFRPLLTGNFNSVSAAYSLRALAACQAALPVSKATVQINEWNNGWKPFRCKAPATRSFRQKLPS